MKLRNVLGICLICVFITPSVRADDALKDYSCGDFTLSYNAKKWNAEGADKKGEDCNVRINSKDTAGLSVLLTFLGNQPPTKEDEDTPNIQATIAFGIPIALSIANKHENNIAVSTGSINFDEYTDLSAHFLIDRPESKDVISLESFAYRPESEKHFVLGAIMSSAKRADLNLAASYFDALQEAYVIVRSIKVTG